MKLQTRYYITVIDVSIKKVKQSRYTFKFQGHLDFKLKFTDLQFKMVTDLMVRLGFL